MAVPLPFLAVPGTSDDAVLFQGNGHSYEPVMSADGKQVAFLSTARFGTTDPPGSSQVYLSDIEGSAPRAVTAEPDGVAGFTMSDEGQTIWYLTRNGAIFQLDTATGQARKKVASTCRANLFDTISPGSALFFTGTCLGSEYRVTLDGGPAPFIARTDSGMWVQAPWTLPAPKPVAVAFDSDSPFDIALNVTVNSHAIAPRCVSAPIHQDWSGYVNTVSPARPNEIVTFYATGLGPVLPPVPTGVPGPSSPLSLVTPPFQCNLPVLFAGLAPGVVGFYQVSVQLPATGVNPTLSCEGGGYGVIWMQP